MRRRADFDRVFRSGRHDSGRLMALRSAENEAGFTRRAVSVSKRVGGAVVRNRVRRRLGEALRSLPVREGFDIVIVPRPGAAQSDYRALRAELQTLLRRARLLAAPAP